MEEEVITATVILPEALLAHWQGHRGLTRKTIEAFPEKELFTYSIGGMRPFSELVLEMLGMAVPGVKGMATGTWDKFEDAQLSKPASKEELLARWDETTVQLNELFPQIPLQRFSETDVAFGQWPGTITSFVLYFIDNEVHHRGQGYVYLRSLGIEPPPFWDR